MKLLSLLLIVPLLFMANCAGPSEAVQVSQSIHEPYESLAYNHAKERFADPNIINSWKKGLKKEMNLDFVRMEMQDFQVVGIEPSPDGTLVALYTAFVINVYMKDGNGARKQIFVNRLTVFIFDKASNKIIDWRTLNQSYKIVSGWDGMVSI